MSLAPVDSGQGGLLAERERGRERRTRGPTRAREARTGERSASRSKIHGREKTTTTTSTTTGTTIFLPVDTGITRRVLLLLLLLLLVRLATTSPRDRATIETPRTTPPVTCPSVGQVASTRFYNYSQPFCELTTSRSFLSLSRFSSLRKN